MQLSGKLTTSETKLQKLREEMVSEIERLQKKHIEETKSLEVCKQFTYWAVSKVNCITTILL